MKFSKLEINKICKGPSNVHMLKFKTLTYLKYSLTITSCTQHYDIFERFPDGSTLWRVSIFGQFEAKRKIQELAEHSENEFFAIDLQAGEPLPAVLLANRKRPRVQGAAGG